MPCLVLLCSSNSTSKTSLLPIKACLQWITKDSSASSNNQWAVQLLSSNKMMTSSVTNLMFKTLLTCLRASLTSILSNVSIREGAWVLKIYSASFSEKEWV